MSDDPLLLAERNHLRQSLACLEQMREAAQRIADYGVDALASEGLGRLRADRLVKERFGEIDRICEALLP